MLVGEAPPALIAVGGGAVTNDRSRVLLAERSSCIYLQSRPSILAARLRHDTRRPLLQGGDVLMRIRELEMQREPLYLAAAAFVLDVSKLPPSTIVRRIAEEAGRFMALSAP